VRWDKVLRANSGVNVPKKIFRPRLPTAAVEHNVDTGFARALSGFNAKVEVVPINQYERYVVQHRW